MTRVIVTPPVLPPAALAELKDWLGITISADDAGLTGLLRAALDICADYIGLTPLVASAARPGASAGGAGAGVRSVPSAYCSFAR